MERSFWFRLALVVVSLSAMVYLIGALGRFWAFLGDVLMAIFLAWLVGSILLHIVGSLMRIPKMRRPWAILIVYLALITLVADFAFLVIPATVDQVLDLTNAVQDLDLSRVTAPVQSFFARYNISLPLLTSFQLESLENLAASAGQWAEENAIQILSNVFSAFFLTGLVIVLSFYFVLDGGRRLNEALKVLPPKAEREVRFILRTIDETFYGYVRGMLVISLLYGVATSAIMLITDLPAALPTGIIAAVLLAVPFVGDWLALILPAVIALIAGDFITFVIVFGSLFLFQQVMLSALTPRILGHAVRMPAMIVVVAVVLGARLAGVPGALMGVPAAAVIYTLSTHYGMRIRRAREAREAEAMAMEEDTDAASPSRGRRSQRPAKADLAIAGASDEAEMNGDGPDAFQDQLRSALEEADDGAPEPPPRRLRHPS